MRNCLQVDDICPAEPMDAEDLLFYCIQAERRESRRESCIQRPATWFFTYLTSKYVFDLQADDVYWCTADVGWITGHSYIVYGILQNGVSQVMYEGAPNHPDEGRFWEIVEKHKVSIFYTHRQRFVLS